MRLRSLVLLAGSPRTRPLQTATKRPLLDLPLELERTFLTHWIAQAAALSASLGAAVPVRVLLEHAGSEPQSGGSNGTLRVRLDHDPQELRGTGGILHDAAVEYDDDDWILVADAHQILFDSLSLLVECLAAREEDVRILAEPDATPIGLKVFRCGVLRDIAAQGYVDLKEQAMPAIAQRYRVGVVRRATAWQRVREPSDYLAALRQYHRRQAGAIAPDNPFAEDWASTFQVVEDPDAVAEGAYLHDSVVLRGGRVEAGATVVRSVVCPGAVVRKGVTLVDQLVQ